MVLELDHIFICTAIAPALTRQFAAPEADCLLSLGLTEGTPNIYPGQGTANRRFFFHNIMLEFLWVHSPEEAQSEIIYPTRLWDRWVNRDKGHCPFGFCLRSPHPQTLPFSAWSYRPAYLPNSVDIFIATNSDVLTEPMLFDLSSGQRPDSFPVPKAQPLQHAIGWKEVTRVETITPSQAPPSSELQTLLDAKLLKLAVGAEYLLVLGFDGEKQGKQVDLRPLPLVCCW